VPAAVLSSSDNVQPASASRVAVAFGVISLWRLRLRHVSGAISTRRDDRPCNSRFAWKGVLPYVVTNRRGDSRCGSLFVVATGKAGTTAAAVRATGFAANGYGDHSPGKYGLRLSDHRGRADRDLLLHHLGATDDRAPKGFAPIAIGLA
jgi:hypothetical protein